MDDAVHVVDGALAAAGLTVDMSGHALWRRLGAIGGDVDERGRRRARPV